MLYNVTSQMKCSMMFSSGGSRESYKRVQTHVEGLIFCQEIPLNDQGGCVIRSVTVQCSQDIVSAARVYMF